MNQDGESKETAISTTSIKPVGISSRYKRPSQVDLDDGISKELMRRLQAHKVDYRNQKKMLIDLRVEAMQKASNRLQKAALETGKDVDTTSKPLALDRLDHANRVNRWKDDKTLAREREAEIFWKQIRGPEPVKPFPKAFLKPSSSKLKRFTPPEPVKCRIVETKSDVVDLEEYLKLDHSELPLHLFDTEEDDPHTPQEWLHRCSQGYTRYYHENSYQWRSCRVLSYDESTQKFLVEFESLGRQKWVRRLNLRFQVENAERFELRFSKATEAREDLKTRLRFDHFLQAQSCKGMRPVEKKILDRIQFFVVNGLPARFSLENDDVIALLGTLKVSVTDEYARIMKKALLYHRYFADEGVRNQFEHLRLHPPPAKPVVSESASVPIAYGTFAKHQKLVHSTHYASSMQILRILQRMYASWEVVFNRLFLVRSHFQPTAASLSPFWTVKASIVSPFSHHFLQLQQTLKPVELPLRLADFQSIELAHLNSTTKVLLIDWRRSLIESIVDNLQDQYDFYIAEIAVYELSPLKRILRGIELRMASQLRSIVLESVEDWVQFLQRLCSSKAAEKEDADPWRSPKDSLIIIDLVLNNGKLRSKPGLKRVCQAIITPLDSIYSAVNQFESIDIELMSLLSLEPKMLLQLDQTASTENTAMELAERIESAKKQILELVQNCMNQVGQVAAQYRSFVEAIQFDAASYVQEWKAQHTSVKNGHSTLKTEAVGEIFSHIQKFQTLIASVELVSYDAIAFPLVCVQCQNLKQQLLESALSIRNSLMDALIHEIRQQTVHVSLTYEGILHRLTGKRNTEAQVAELKAYISQSKVLTRQMKLKADEIHGWVTMLSELEYKLTDEDFALVYSIQEWPLKIEYTASVCETALEEDKSRLVDRLKMEKKAFQVDLNRYQAEARAFSRYENIDATNKYVELAVTLYDSIQEAKQKAADFNAREAVFDLPPTEYSMLDTLETGFMPFYTLWTMSSDFAQSRQTWLNGAFMDLDGSAIENAITEWCNNSSKLSKTLDKSAPGSAQVARMLHEQTQEFRAYLPVIQRLASQALQERHWDEIRQIVGFEESEEDLTLYALLEKGVTLHFEAVEKIGACAEKEFSLQRTLTAMIAEWEKVDVQCVSYRTSETFVLQGIDEIVTLLEDHLLKTQSLRSSPYIHHIEKDCKSWEKKLQYAQQVLDEWMQCQRTWLYLESIFSSEDIMRQMPNESRRFAAVDAFWRKVMEEAVTDANFMTLIAMEKLLTKFEKANEKLDEIQKGLSDYLELKRLAFPRFFFLSNDELLEILSQTKEPQAVQPHLGKCFEGIHRVSFQVDDQKKELQITEMKSAEGENVLLHRNIEPESAANKGNVEMWLAQLESVQWESIRDHIQRALESYPYKPREEWVLDWPAQVVLAVSQVFWTREVTEALLDRGCSGLKTYLLTLNDQLDHIVAIVRGDLTKLNRTTIGALIVIDVHARDTIAHMISKGVEKEQDFEWVSQLRYYWNQDAQLQARIVNARVMYGYEYLGNSMRLVITPLTDRCYRTMMGAIDALYGGAPEGPAGTGKTETVKDLSKSIAIQCVVFNCSDGLDYLAMAKFFKGLAACGSWCCFDEFNRINIEVLSVIAQQILTINTAKRLNAETFVFENTRLRLNKSANVFITMNPGYAGRAELPDNLKALFRPCAMMIPDYALIAEIRLYSFGFSNAQKNARKLTQVLQLCSEQCSGQSHYDYGMRAINSILVAAGVLRQQLGQDPHWTEDKIVLKSIRDVNVPKFTTQDLPLFRGIIADLFGDLECVNPHDDSLAATITSVCLKGVLLRPEPSPSIPLVCSASFREKMMQIYQTVQIRHGLMIVGHTMSGKTCMIHTLAQAINACFYQSKVQSQISIHTINPKSISIGKLYGSFDANTHEWSDGVLASIYRECARDLSLDMNHWVMFDGPVDAVWIENMNTVLDDNKKLCLMSGEIIKMTERMRMMFETDDLEQASPATVSRVGMIYVEKNAVGIESLIQIWLQTRLPASLKPAKESIRKSFSSLVPPLLYFVENHCIVPISVSSMELCASLLRLFECLIADANSENFGHFVLENLFLQSIIWSIGIVLEEASRVQFDHYIRELVSGSISALSFGFHDKFLAKHPVYELNASRTASLLPQEGSVYDYHFDIESAGWVPWVTSSEISEFVIPRESFFTSILVPTIDTKRHSWILSTLLEHHHHILCTGETGTGKSVSIQQKLREASTQAFTSIYINFSAQTSASQTQDLIESKLDKRRKGVLGPRVGSHCVVFVDDLNMPAKEVYGAQPPIELLRQVMDHSGWYNRKDTLFTQLVDVQFIAAMGPPGGGRSRITQRCARHFHLIHFLPFDKTCLSVIFSHIAAWWLAPFDQVVTSQADGIVQATLEIYHRIASSLLPTPARSHYTFNLRDLSKVFQGISQGTPQTVHDVDDLIRLWSHECLRVFSDRLINGQDRRWFYKAMEETVSKCFHLEYQAVLGSNRTLLYGNFSSESDERKTYVDLSDRQLVQRMMEASLEEYNATKSSRMGLVLFQNAIEHIARISRIIHQPYGHALVVGMGGSGRRSLTILASYMAKYQLIQLEMARAYGLTEWKTDLKRVLHLSGIQNLPTVFLLSDAQIVQECFLDDVNALLNTGEVSSLWSLEELGQIQDALEAVVTAEGAFDAYSFFVSRCRSNLHIVLALSPDGEDFRRRLRMFPSFVNCCTIDWFTKWPKEALLSVASHSLRQIPDLSSELETQLADCCMSMQKCVIEIATEYHQRLNRQCYITPASYLDFLHTFSRLLHNTRDHISSRSKRYGTGLSKLVETAQQVEQMQIELEALQPQLTIATTETDALLQNISHQQDEANWTKNIVASEEQLCNEQAAKANSIKTSCESELALAIPALENALQALQTLTKGDITEIKAMKKPPDGVKLVMEAVCIMMNVAPVRVKDPNGTRKIDDYWGPAQKHLLGDTRFLQNLLEYDKDHIRPEAIDKVEPYTKNSDFQADKIKKASVAASGLCAWVHAMVVYHSVAKVVAPKREALEVATQALLKAQTELQSKQTALQLVLDKVERLESELFEANERKSDLQQQVGDCCVKVSRATQLINGLGGEKLRWEGMLARLKTIYTNMVGDILLSSGVVSYFGAFTSVFRAKALQQWTACIQAKGEPLICSHSFSFADTLSDPVQIRLWTIAKLPNDAFSIDNAILIQQSSRWPLLIDPQNQANTWIRNMNPSNLKVVRPNQSGFSRALEHALMIGAAVLLENVAIPLDPVLDPILRKQISRKGDIYSIQFGDSVVEYDPSFRLYLTTNVGNPKFTAEVYAKVNVVNFMATPEGLQDQMLGIIVAKEEPVLEQQREQLVVEDSKHKKMLQEIEDEILRLLQGAKGNILSDQSLIETLAASKVTAVTIEEKVREAASTQERIQEKRAAYEIVAIRSAQLFFCLCDLNVLDPMYQYSLEWYIHLFETAISNTERTTKLQERLWSLNNTFTLLLYQHVCRSLFEKDKVLFTFLLTVKVMSTEKRVHASEVRYFFTGNTQIQDNYKKPIGTDHWLTDSVWTNMIGLQTFPPFMPILTSFTNQVQEWENVSLASKPLEYLASMPIVSHLSAFQRLLLVRCLRPDAVLPSVTSFIVSEMGQEYMEPPPFNLKASFDDSTCATPLIIVLTPGADPMLELMKLADTNGFTDKLIAISLGQGQGPLAENAILQAIDTGTWVCLQNCHLCTSWLPILDRVSEDITVSRAHPSFRLWLTSEPTPLFPSSLLQRGIKVTNEPPQGIRANLRKTFASISPNWLEEPSFTYVHEFRKLFFGLCFFHAMIQERTKFGPLGWNIPYVFSLSDSIISSSQLYHILRDLTPKDLIPYDALRYLTGECNYGGRVTDDKDRRCLLALLTDIYTPGIMESSFTFSSGVYIVPPWKGSITPHLMYIDSLPQYDIPEIFGLHENANISLAVSKTMEFLSAALNTQPQNATGALESWDQQLKALVSDISSRLPEAFDMEQAAIDFPVRYEESTNTVLLQELSRYNQLLNVITTSLDELERALKGFVVLSSELEAMGNSMINGQVPERWVAMSYPSLKPLGSWVQDFLRRMEFLREWFLHKIPPFVYWISGFFFTQAFITGILQNYARKYKIPIDQVGYDMTILSIVSPLLIQEKADDGAYIYGLFMEGAGWDFANIVITESRPRELHVAMPIIHLLPRRRDDIEPVREVEPQGTAHIYLCPMYRTSLRRGTLSTTGHSTNFVMFVRLPMSLKHSQSHWIRRGAALLTQLDT
uniref:PREDICTED: dynein heavy chain 7 putative n=1 Tax=Albugo laibachii Nc14 TaxID=890382 RepID=F0WA77_9STRA|nr:PREDICTED: dynein heavy chain 7 putative [Albugo laibachii Nc14]|eukprot:CCA18047.1 PREDICTED: dynein heavy chain 7 putative [Albugo laibachii Nc14]